MKHYLHPCEHHFSLFKVWFSRCSLYGLVNINDGMNTTYLCNTMCHLSWLYEWRFQMKTCIFPIYFGKHSFYIYLLVGIASLILAIRSCPLWNERQNMFWFISRCLFQLRFYNVVMQHCRLRLIPHLGLHYLRPHFHICLGRPIKLRIETWNCFTPLINYRLRRAVFEESHYLPDASANLLQTVKTESWLQEQISFKSLLMQMLIALFLFGNGYTYKGGNCVKCVFAAFINRAPP